MKKRFISLILALAVLTGLLAGCGSKADAPATNAPAVEATGEKITVILPRHEMDTIGFYEEKTREFEAQTGIKVELILMSWDQVADRLTADLAAGGGTYDVIELDNSWVEKYVNNGWIAPLNDYITDEMKAGIIPGLLDKFSSGDQLYGIAWNNDTRFYMYNAAKLQEIGMDHAPATWDEALDAYGKLKEKGLVNAAYIDCYNQEWAGATELIFLTASFGGKLLDEDGHPVMGKDAKTKAAYEFLVQGLESGFIDASSLTSSQETTNDVFCMGDTFLFLQAWPSVYANANNSEVSNIVGQIDVVLPYLIWLLKGYIDGIPTELDEAALIDGCTRVQSFFRVILPVAGTGLAATVIFAFILSWNEFFYAVNFTSTTAAKTLPVLITEFSSKFGSNYILTCTAGVLTSLPPVLVALIFQRYIISGLSAGAVKG